jgi:hypothetical protein
MRFTRYRRPSLILRRISSTTACAHARFSPSVIVDHGFGGRTASRSSRPMRSTLPSPRPWPSGICAGDRDRDRALAVPGPVLRGVPGRHQAGQRGRRGTYQGERRPTFTDADRADARLTSPGTASTAIFGSRKRCSTPSWRRRWPRAGRTQRARDLEALDHLRDHALPGLGEELVVVSSSTCCPAPNPRSRVPSRPSAHLARARGSANPESERLEEVSLRVCERDGALGYQRAFALG